MKNKRGTARIVEHGESYICQFPECGCRNRDIITGYICIEHEKKKYHASCARYAHIAYTPPKAAKRKREAE